MMNLIGDTYGRLTVLKEAQPRKNLRRWWCKCACGNTVIVYQTALRTKGHTRSCGCLNREAMSQRNTTHGGSRTVEYCAWSSMIQRCENPKNQYYQSYGGRGIKVCQRWRESFAAFREDMGMRPNSKMMVERRENDGDYTPENCYWATRIEQNRNRRKFGTGWRANSH